MIHQKNIGLGAYAIARVSEIGVFHTSRNKAFSETDQDADPIAAVLVSAAGGAAASLVRSHVRAYRPRADFLKAFSAGNIRPILSLEMARDRAYHGARHLKEV